MSNVERVTTIGTYQWRSKSGEPHTNKILTASNPEAPAGTGWKLIGSAATDGGIFWFWERKLGGVVG